MTIETNYTPDTYNGNGILDTFAITFEFLSISTNVAVAIKVVATGVITPKTAGTHYDISGTNVVFTAGNVPASGEIVIITLNPSYTQTSDYVPRTKISQSSIELDLDKRTLEAQLNKDIRERAVKVDETIDIDTVSTNLPVSANKYLKWNPAGTALELQTLSATAGLGSIEEDVSPTLGNNLDTNGYTVDGRDIATDGTKLDGIEALADVTDFTNVAQALASPSLSAPGSLSGSDQLLIRDVSDGDILKRTTVQEVTDFPSWNKAKAWVNFDGTGTILIRSSFNVSSITDLGTGYYRIHFTTPFNDVNYVGAVGVAWARNNISVGINRSVGYDELAIYSNSVLVDSPRVCVVYFSE